MVRPRENMDVQNTALFCLICCLWLTLGMYAIVRGLFVGSQHRLCAPISCVVLCTRYVFLPSLLGLSRCRLACRSCGHLEVIISYNLEFCSEQSNRARVWQLWQNNSPGCQSALQMCTHCSLCYFLRLRETQSRLWIYTLGDGPRQESHDVR